MTKLLQRKVLLVSLIEQEAFLPVGDSPRRRVPPTDHSHERSIVRRRHQSGCADQSYGMEPARHTNTPQEDLKTRIRLASHKPRDSARIVRCHFKERGGIVDFPSQRAAHLLSSNVNSRDAHTKHGLRQGMSGSFPWTLSTSQSRRERVEQAGNLSCHPVALHPSSSARGDTLKHSACGTDAHSC